MRIKDMITQGEVSWYVNNFSIVLVWEKHRKICSLILRVGLKSRLMYVVVYLQNVIKVAKKVHLATIWKNVQDL